MKPWTIDDIKERFSEFLGDTQHLSESQQQARRRILEAASQHFARFGYRRANIGDIAKDAGVGKGTVYLHFKNKKDLLLACLSKEKEQLVPELESVMAQPAEQQLEAYLKTILHFSLKAPLGRALLRGDREIEALVDDLGSEMMDQNRGQGAALVSTFIEPLAPHLTETEREELAAVMNVMGYLCAHLDEPAVLGIQVDRFVQLLAGLITRGVAGEYQLK